MTPTLDTTTNNSFRYPTAANNGSDFGTGLQDFATDVDGMWQAGTLVSRPTASSVKAGTHYYATDAGAYSVSNGSTWGLLGSPSPVGAMSQYAGASDPIDADGVTRWLICNGRAISRTTYATLFTVLSTTYGSGDGSTTFNIPDLRGRVPVGADPTGAHLPVNEPALASGGGEEQHTLSTGEMPVHDHGYGGYVAIGATATFGAQPVASSPDEATAVNYPVEGLDNEPNTSNAGSGDAHNNLQPYLAVNHIVKVL
jgi:microcystin-dependent protein